MSWQKSFNILLRFTIPNFCFFLKKNPIRKERKMMWKSNFFLRILKKIKLEKPIFLASPIFYLSHTYNVYKLYTLKMRFEMYIAIFNLYNTIQFERNNFKECAEIPNFGTGNWHSVASIETSVSSVLRNFISVFGLVSRKKTQ